MLRMTRSAECLGHRVHVAQITDTHVMALNRLALHRIYCHLQHSEVSLLLHLFGLEGFFEACYHIVGIFVLGILLAQLRHSTQHSQPPAPAGHVPL